MANEVNTTGSRPARRTIVKGAAWAVPAIAVAAPAAQAAASCVPEFRALPGSQKCCEGQIKTMLAKIEIVDVNGCLSQGEEICIESVLPTNGGTVAETTYVPSACTTEGGTIDVYLYNVSNCGVNLTVAFRVDDGPLQYAELKSDNITWGDDCPVLPPGAEAKSDVEEPSTDVEEPSTDVEEPSTDVEEPSTDVEEPSTDVEEPSTDVEDTSADSDTSNN